MQTKTQETVRIKKKNCNFADDYINKYTIGE